MKYQSSLFAVVIISVAFCATGVHAHSLGNSFEVPYDEYLIDVGYSSEVFVADTSMLFDFSLWKGKEKKPVQFTDVWLRIARVEGEAEVPVFASGIHSFGSIQTPVTFTFPSAGKYIVSVRYENELETIAKTEIPIQVNSGYAWGMGMTEWISYVGIGMFALGISVGSVRKYI